MTMQIASASSPQVDSGATPKTDPTSKSASSLGNERVFLQLLVAQIKNQNPLTPMDSTQFMSQLAQFSNLEQLITLNTTVGKIGTTLGVAPDAQQTDDSGSLPV
jgi:flagellar basal-body rod modification protein FlgD